jgi:hypothetical protein
LASACLSLGIAELDASVLQSRSNFAITHPASREVYKRGFQGIYYLSRHGHDFENWALFEPFDLRDTAVRHISTDDPALLEAVQILGLTLLK